VTSQVGKRANVDVVLEVAPAHVRAEGQPIWRAPNGVILIRAVAANAIVDLRAMSKRARRDEAELRDAFRKTQ